jgi:uncharacterized protein YdaU (DUF1376 family)
MALKITADRDVWLQCFASALTGLLANNQTTTHEPEQLIRQAGKLADIALTKAQARYADEDSRAPRQAAAGPTADRAVAAAARDRSVGDALDPGEAGQPQAQTRSSAFPFYAADFLASMGLLSNAAVGAHIRMLAHAWSSGPIPDQPKALARAMNHSVGDPSFDDIWTELKSKWFLTKRGWINCRLEVVRWERASYLERHGVPVARPEPSAKDAKDSARAEPRVSPSSPAPTRR